jgi:ADP-dependent NAD(P)H-hydrate dehydratase / NAD(P)H-hydrate epimerase
MEKISKNILKGLYKPLKQSHKGDNGKLTIVGGSKLFHGASLWALKTASRIVDMVFYSTVEENKKLTKKLKTNLYDFICVPRGREEDYINQSDAILIGPGLVRGSKKYTGTNESGKYTKKLTSKLLKKFPEKKWLIDAGSLQEMDKNLLKPLKKVVITPHPKEFKKLFNLKVPKNTKQKELLLLKTARKYNCTIVLKGETDFICNKNTCKINKTGNQGMTKGGTGDVLAGLIASLMCKNDIFLAAQAGAYINGKAGDELYKKMGPYFNATDLTDQIPLTMKNLLGY